MMFTIRYLQAVAVALVFVHSVDAQIVIQPPVPRYKVGDRLIVVEQAVIQVGNDVRQILGRGQDVRLDGVYQDKLLVKNVTAGWISQGLVAPPAVAVGLFTEQIAWNPWDAGAYYARGITQENLNQYDLAIADFNAAIRLDPRQACGFIGRGNCWANTGDSVKAIADYTEAIRLYPGLPIAYVNRARMWNATGDFAKAIADATEAIRITPTYANAYSARAIAFAATQQFAEASADCDRIAAISTPGVSGYNDVAWFLATSPVVGIRNGSKAVEFASKAASLTYELDGAVLDTLAIAWAESADFSQAVAWEQKAIAVSSDRDRIDFENHLKLFQASRTLRDGQLTTSRLKNPASDSD